MPGKTALHFLPAKKTVSRSHKLGANSKNYLPRWCDHPLSALLSQQEGSKEPDFKSNLEGSFSPYSSVLQQMIFILFQPAITYFIGHWLKCSYSPSLLWMNVYPPSTKDPGTKVSASENVCAGPRGQPCPAWQVNMLMLWQPSQAHAWVQLERDRLL